MSLSQPSKLSVMSSIKCSSCGKAIPLSTLVNHICDASLGYTTPAPPPKNPFKLEMPRYDPAVQTGYSDKSLPFLPTPSDSIWNKPLPPRINPDYANEIFSDTPPYSASGSSDSSRDGRSASPMTPSTQITSPGSSFFGREKVTRTPSPPSTFQRGDSPLKMGLTSISENPPPVPSKQGPNVFQRLNVGVTGPFSRTASGRRGPGLPSSPSSTVDRKAREENRDVMDRRTPSPINETLMALSGRRPSVDQTLSQEKNDSKPYGYQLNWEKPLPDPEKQEFVSSHRRDDSNKSFGPTFDNETKYVPWWLKESNSQKNDEKNNEPVNSWDKPLPPPFSGPLRTIDESPQSRPKTANSGEERGRNPFGIERGDPAIQYGLDDSSKPLNNSSHLYSNSDPELKAEQSSGHNHNHYNNDDNPFSSSYPHRNNYNQHSHQHSQQSFESSSSHKFNNSTSSQSPTSNASPERNNWGYNASRAPVTTSTSATKHTCRGCSLVIHGRSLVDSSKRLTGRYHKECFVCTDCRAPFPSGEFYVLDNLPYCAFDYHRRNNSLCSGCGIGVEGNYLQTGGDSPVQESKLWHLECFQCAKCNCILREEYWELDGKALCTKDAFPNGFGLGRQNSKDEGRDKLGALGSTLSPGLGGRNPERRRTKLFMGSNVGNNGGAMGLGMSGFGRMNSGSGMGSGVGGGYGRNMNPPRRW